MHDKFTGINGSENNLKNSIKYLKEASKELNIKIRIKIGHLITELSYSDLNELMDWCEKEELELYPEIPVFNNTKINGIMIKSKEKIENISKKLLEWKKSNKPILIGYSSIPFIKKYMKKEKIKSPCPIGFYDIYIDCKGNVYTGCWYLPPIGNIREKDIEKILRSSKVNIYKMLLRKCNGCTCGYNMMSKYYIPYLIESHQMLEDIKGEEEQ